MPDDMFYDGVEQEEEESPIKQDKNAYDRKIEAIPKPPLNIGIDSDGIYQDVIDAAEHSQLDIAAIEKFTTVSQRREEVYQVLDTMSEDTLIASALEIYAADITETNDAGMVMWATSDDENIQKYITFLLDTMNVDKHLYGWAYSLCKYGDLYLRLYKESEFNDGLFDKEEEELEDKKRKALHESAEPLNEAVIIKAYSKNDKYAHYLEQVANPGEMFELTKFGKSYAYIQAKPGYSLTNQDQESVYNDYYKFRFYKDDVTIFSPTNFVHACLDDNSTRTPEEVSIYLDKNQVTNQDSKFSYRVKRGQSLLYKMFKIWRMMTLLEDSLLLNRVTKSSIYRILNVEVGDMPKEQVQLTLQRLKQKLEQKQALNKGVSMSEYTNAGPMENIIYVPTREGKGNISSQQLGGDVDVKSLADVDFFKNKFYAALGIPKQFLGDTDDSTGFNGGTSLSLISSSYAKRIKRIQNALIQAITDAINIMLLDIGQDSYVNKFQLHMQAPTTQEEVDRRDNMASQVQLVSDIVNMLNDSIEDPIAQLKVLKAMISTVVTDAEVLTILQNEIDRLEEEKDLGADDFDSGDDSLDNDSAGGDFDMDIDIDAGGGGDSTGDFDDLGDFDDSDVDTETSDNDLPTPEQINPDVDFTDNTAEI